MNISRIRAHPIGGDYYVTPDLSYGEEGEKKEGRDNQWDGKKAHAPLTFRSSFERTAESKLWPIRQWGGETDSNL